MKISRKIRLRLEATRMGWRVQNTRNKKNRETENDIELWFDVFCFVFSWKPFSFYFRPFSSFFIPRKNFLDNIIFWLLRHKVFLELWQNTPFILIALLPLVLLRKIQFPFWFEEGKNDRKNLYPPDHCVSSSVFLQVNEWTWKNYRQQ